MRCVRSLFEHSPGFDRLRLWPASGRLLAVTFLGYSVVGATRGPQPRSISVRRRILGQAPRVVLFLLLLSSAASWAEEPAVPTLSGTTLDAASRIPVQDQGRVKPLSTFADFTLLNIHHRRTFQLADARKLNGIEWFLRTALFPDATADERVFRIEDSDVLDEIGLGAIKRKRRDLYSYAELSRGRAQLMKKYLQSVDVDSRKQTRDQKRIVGLAHKLFLYENVRRVFATPLGSSSLRLVSPLDAVDGKRAEWTTVGLFGQSLEAVRDPGRGWLAAWNGVCDSRGNADELERAMAALLDASRARAESSGAYRGIELEVHYHSFDAFTKALVLFLVSFVLVCMSWLFPRRRWVVRAIVALLVSATALVVYGIVLRCVLRGRPPVSTLYETILFVTGTVVITALAIEWINRRRIGLAAAAVLGAFGLFLAGRYEEIDGKDTMPQLLAVLDTNFWLATHVTCVTIGYAAGLLAAAIAHVYVLGKAFRFRREDHEFYRGVARMVYGTLAFSLVFSVVGTILGGVWANESWGRFWGWDPKENGALMIVLSQLAIIHARLGGYIKGFGVSMAAIGSAIVIGFSWWGVNLLGIGLHAYGFTEGLQTALDTFYLVEIVVLVFAGSLWGYEWVALSAERRKRSELR
jgi:ABC-type transport system involved in cytochrome c biogenesis permease subunit